MNIKNALIVGGTDGIGAAIALELYKQGVKVVVIGRSQEKAN
jgi:NAD(P)-dependent dehydrogenase (short-subunit alcohol dehydrogenase family)